jgi:hypothetical protein
MAVFKKTADSAIGRRPILGDKRIFFLRFAEKNIKIEALCSSILIG